MPDMEVPADLVALQRAVYAARAATRTATDDDRHERRQAELDAVLALHRHPAYGSVPWQELRNAALDEGAPPTG